jgi:hypothetical protein
LSKFPEVETERRGKPGWVRLHAALIAIPLGGDSSFLFTGGTLHFLGEDLSDQVNVVALVMGFEFLGASVFAVGWGEARR